MGGSDRFTERAQESTSDGLTGSIFGTEDLFCVLNNQTNNLKDKQSNEVGEEVGEEEGEYLPKNGKGVETNQELGCHPVVDDEEDMFASTPEVDNNDNDQGNHHHQSEDVQIESSWGSDVIADGHNVENVDLGEKKCGDTLREVGEAVCNSGDRTENRGKSYADGAEKTVEGGGVERAKGSRRFHQKVVPVNRSARGSTTDVVPSRVTRSSSRTSCN